MMSFARITWFGWLVLLIWLVVAALVVHVVRTRRLPSVQGLPPAGVLGAFLLWLVALLAVAWDIARLDPVRYHWAILVFALSVLIFLFSASGARQRETLAPGGPDRKGYQVHLVIVCFAFLVASLTGISMRANFIGSGTPPPSAVSDPLDASEIADVVAYARSLDYDNSSHAAEDEQFLAFDTTGAIRGPRARVTPVRSAYLNSRSDLEGVGNGRGRIIARVWVDPTFKGPQQEAGYSKLGLPPGTSYVWVDSLQASDSMRVLIVPDTVAGAVVRASRRAFLHRVVYRAGSNARWQWNNDECVCPSCSHMYQCEWC